MASQSQNARLQFLLADGIAREVIVLEICRYLGNDALVKPGEVEGQKGFWVTAGSHLTPEMIHNIKLDSQRWWEEQDLHRSGQAYRVVEAQHARYPATMAVPFSPASSRYDRTAEWLMNTTETSSQIMTTVTSEVQMTDVGSSSGTSESVSMTH